MHHQYDSYISFLSFTFLQDVDPNTEIRSVTFAEEFHTCFGRSWKIQDFRRDRVARWAEHVLLAIEKHKANFGSEEEYKLYPANFQLIKGSHNSMPVLQLPLIPDSNEFKSEYIFPYNRKPVTERNFLSILTLKKIHINKSVLLTSSYTLLTG